MRRWGAKSYKAASTAMSRARSEALQRSPVVADRIYLIEIETATGKRTATGEYLALAVSPHGMMSADDLIAWLTLSADE